MNENDLIYSFAKEHMIRASGLLSLMMPQTPGVGIGIKGLDGRYQLANKAMETLFGKSAEQIINMTDTDLFSPEVATQLQRSDQQISDGAAAASDELDLSINGVLMRCLWLKFPVMGPDGRILFIGAVMLDISRQEYVAEMQQTLDQLQQTNQELQRTLVELDRLASTDKLTGAWNRRRLEEAVINEMDRLRRYDHPLSMMIIDIDLFKKVNDHHGHAVGDQVLAVLAAVVQSTHRATDSLTRWGGEEFVVLCPNTTLSTSAMLAKRLRERIAKAVFPAVKNITVSIGVAECMSGETWEQWFKRADDALYLAKACGRNQVQIAPETPHRVGVGENVSANFVQLSWHPAYECGHTLIDAQHRALFGHANNLLAAILSGRPADEVATVIDALIRDVVQHFQDEESIFTAAGYPGAAKHAAIHRQLVDSAVILVGRFHAGTLGIGELFQYLAHDVVARHMLGADREFFPYLEALR
jgi:diguanylate cyclase (GGDEF)-like protein/hemerythrin-like metal-binding protein/PAS domain S-box-containing protein